MEDSLDGLPNELGCTGLYEDTAARDKVLADGVLEFAPAHTLWSDGAVKTRWIQVPEGEAIDASDPEGWVFPVGTKAWKEFRKGEKRIETRLYEKTADNNWAKTTYAWNARETEATRAAGTNLTVDGEQYHLPSGVECGECHDGRKDKLLGFEQAALGLPGATGVTLAELVASDRLKNFTGPTEYTIGDDGTELAEPALGWLHMNCGVSCHNGNPGSKGFSRGMHLQLTIEELDGRDPSQSGPLTTTIDQDAATLRWLGWKRIVAGSPEDSLLYKLISQRGDKAEQMPPLGSTVVDAPFVELIADWIRKLPTEPAAETESGPE